MSDVTADLVRRVAALEAMKRPEISRYALSIYVLSVAQTIPDNNLSFDTILYNAAEYDPLSLVTYVAATDWYWTAPFPGTATVCAKMMFASSASWADGDAAEIDLHLNNAKKTVIDRKDNNPAGSFVRLGGVVKLRVAAGDTLRVKAYQNSGTPGGLGIYNASFGFNRVEIELRG